MADCPVSRRYWTADCRSRTGRRKEHSGDYFLEWPRIWFGWTGAYKVSGKQLTVVADVILAGFCPPEEWTESLAVVKAFKGELNIEEVEDQVLLRDKDGRTRVRLVPFDLPPSGPTK